MNFTLATLNAWSADWGEGLWRASWQGGLALGLVWLVCRGGRWLSPRVQGWLWRLACLKLLLTFCWAGAVNLPLLPSLPEVQTATDIKVPDGQSLPLIVASGNDRAADWPLSAMPFEPSLSLTGGLFLGWLLGVGACGLLLFRNSLRVRCLRDQCRPIRDASALDVLDELCVYFRVAPRPFLLSSVEARGPLLLGPVRPTIVLPVAVLRARPLNELRLILAHEVAHCRRRDLLWNWLPAVCQCLFFFHPLVWLAAREARLAQESACDELALTHTSATPAGYGRMLLALATPEPFEPLVGCAAVGAAA